MALESLRQGGEGGEGMAGSTYGRAGRNNDQVCGGAEVGVVPRRSTQDRCWSCHPAAPNLPRVRDARASARVRGHGPRTSRSALVSCGRRSTTVSAWFSLLKTTQRRRPSSARALSSPAPAPALVSWATVETEEGRLKEWRVSSFAIACARHVDDMRSVDARVLVYLSRRYVRGPSSASACSHPRTTTQLH